MKKKCFVIMPISDLDGYANGHFGRVYEHIIKPACDFAGLYPIRADDIMTTNYIALDIIKHIINSEMALCDLSGRNPNVLYELGIRQAFNLPVTLIKDQKTSRIFDIQGFRDLEYDESLRIDCVQETVEALAELIKNTLENTHEVNSLVGLLGIEPAKVTSKTKISAEAELILNSISGLEKRISEIEIKFQPVQKTISANPNTKAILPEDVGGILSRQDIENLQIGDKVYHSRYGYGEIITLNGSNWMNKSARIKFESEEKQIAIRVAQIRKLK